MIESPAQFLGWPGPLDAASVVAALRYALVALALLSAVQLARGFERRAVGIGMIGFTIAVAFWVLALGRPYGVLVDADATRRAGDISVISISPSQEGLVAGSPARDGAATWLVRRGVPATIVHLLPSFTPLVATPLVAVVLWLGWRARAQRAVAVLLLLWCGSSWLGATRGLDVLGAFWASPTSAARWLGVCALVVGSTRLRAGRGGAGPFCLVVGLAVLHGGYGPGAPDWIDLPSILLLEQGLVMLPAMLGMLRRPDAAALILSGVGGFALALASAGLPLDALAAHASYRTGLILSAAMGLVDFAPAIGSRMARAPWFERSRLDRSWLALAACLAILAPGSVLVFWNPSTGSNAVYARSLEPLSMTLEPALEWIRSETPPTTRVMASPAYAASVAVRAGRRVLRAAELRPAADEALRVRAERILLFRRPLPDWVRGYGIDYVLAAPGDFRARGLGQPQDLIGVPGLHLGYRDASGIHVFSVVDGDLGAKPPAGP